MDPTNLLRLVLMLAAVGLVLVISTRVLGRLSAQAGI